MNKIKIMVNWANHLIVHTSAAIGSPEYVHLLNQGYVQVGEIKQPSEIRVFWNSEYFNARDKYVRDIRTESDTITT